MRIREREKESFIRGKGEKERRRLFKVGEKKRKEKYRRQEKRKIKKGFNID